MKKNLIGIRHAALLLFVLVFAQEAASGAGKTYEGQLAEARRFADEKSWALARDAYAEASKVAPDDDAKRWCGLSVVDATWRAVSRDAWNSPAGTQWRTEIKSMFDSLLLDYEKSKRRKDSFWVAVMKNRAEYHGAVSMAQNARLDDLETVADFFASLPTSDSNTAAHLESLRDIAAEVSRLNHVSDDRREKLIQRFADAGERADFPVEDRAWRMFQRAVLSTDFGKAAVAEQRARWIAAVDAAKGTPSLPVARARLFVFDTLQARAGGDVANDTPADIGVLMNRIAELRGELAAISGLPGAREADALLASFPKWWTHPVLHFNAPDLLPTGVPLLINYATANCGDITAELYQFAPRAERPTDMNEYRRHGIITIPEHYKNWQAGGRLVKKIVLPGSSKGTGTWVSATAEIIGELKPGEYSLGLTGSGVNAQISVLNIIVSDVRAFAVFSKDGPKRLLVFRHDTGEPMAGVPVSGTHKSKTWSAQTDKSGFALLPDEFEWQSEPYKTPEDFLAFAEGQPIRISGWHDYDYFSNPEQEIFADVFFDRPLYRPGETVYWKVIARERRDGRFVPCEKKLALKIESGRSEEPLVDGLPLALNKNGTAHGDLVLPATMRPNAFGIYLSVLGADGKKSGGDVYLPRAFSVENYVASSIRATAELSDPDTGAQPGRDLEFLVRAEYFSGGPLAGARVNATFDVSWYDDKKLPLETVSQIRSWIDLRGKTPLESVTDAKGEARIRLPLSSLLPDGMRIKLLADVMIDGAAPVRAWVDAVVSKEEHLRMNSLKAGSGVARPGEEIVFSAHVGNDRGASRAFFGTARIMEMKWKPFWYLPDGTKVNAKERDEMLRRSDWEAVQRMIPGSYLGKSNWEHSEAVALPVSCGENGLLKIPFTPRHAGLFTVKLENAGQNAIPDDGRLFNESPVLAVADDATTELAFWPESGNVLGLDAWKAGQPLRLLVVLPEGVHRAVLTLCAEDEVVTQLVQSSGRVAWVSIERAPRAFGIVHYILWHEGRRGRSSSGSARITAKDEGSLAVTVAPVSPEARPGDMAKIGISVRDSQGRPVQSELAIAVSDQSVRELAGSGKRDGIMETRLMWWRKLARVHMNGTFAQGAYEEGKLLRDFRPGALLDPTTKPMSHRDLLDCDMEELLLGEDGAGYAAASTRANSRVSMNIRRHFSSTAYWAPEVMTDANGEAVVSFKYPDNLTQWNIRAVAVGEDGNSFGDGVAFAQTTLPFQARLQTPRYLIEGDSAVLSALLVNTTDENLTAATSLKVEGASSSRQGTQDAPLTMTNAVSVAPQSDTRITAWPVKADRKGEAVFELSAQTEKESDGMETRIPVHEDGLRQDIATSARLAADARECSLAFVMPEKLDRSRAQMTLQLSPNQAAAMLDALPYLIDYPYGCVEQTMNRFMPAVIVKKTLADLGLDAGVLEKRIMKNTRAGRQKANATALDDVISQGLARLAGAEIEGGVFGWWPGARRGNPWMTAYVGWGLHLAKSAGVPVSDAMLERVTSAMVDQVTDTGEYKCAGEVAAWTLSILAQTNWRPGKDSTDDENGLRAVFARAYAARDELSASGRALLLIAAGRFGLPDEKAVLLRNLQNGARRVRSEGMGDTVHWGAGSGYYRAEEGAVEATAFTLLALLHTDAAHPLVEPAVNWLMLNRRGSAWQNTRATAFAILALNQYLTRRMAAFPEAKVDVLINGKLLRTLTLNRDTLTGSGSEACAFDVNALLLREGENTITLRRAGGTSPVYATALASVWASGEAVKPASHLVATSREFIRQKVERKADGMMRIMPHPMGVVANNAASTGEMVTARVALSVPNALDYVIVAVPKPAGCEPVNALSGWDARLVRVDGKSIDDDDDDDDDFDNDIASSAAAKGRRIYREEHDDHSAFFLDHVEAGEWEIRFTMRAVTPGDFRALPVKVEAMYAPEVRANSDARRVRVE